MPVVAVAGLLVSAYSAVNASQQQQRAMDLQKSAIQQDQVFRQKQLDDYEKQYGPMRDALNRQASSESPLNLGPTWAKIQANFDQSGRNNEASMARKGMLGSGLDKANALETGRAFTLSDAFGKGLQARDALRERLANAGKNMPQQAGFASQGNQEMAGMYGQNASMYGNLAGQAGQGIMSSLGALGYSLGRRPPEIAPPAPDISSTVDRRMVQNALGDSPINMGNLSPTFNGNELPSSPITAGGPWDTGFTWGRG